MRIDDLNRTPLTQAAERADEASGKQPAEKNASHAEGLDKADVSEVAQALVSTDPSRLEQLRLQVQSGEYNVSADKLAASIIDAHLGD